MSGHSKWSQIKRQKGAADVKRGVVFTKMTREIMLAAREGGPDPEANFRLRLAMDRARNVNMPHANIQRAIEEARHRKLKTAALLGRDGGSVAGIADVDLIVKGGSTARIQEAHKFILHVLCEICEARLPRK